MIITIVSTTPDSAACPWTRGSTQHID
jgi:hypothetical protein